MPRKPTGRPSGRPAKPFRRYHGWIVTAVEAFVSGDLSTKQINMTTRANALSAVHAFNRARARYVEEAQEAGNFDESDVALDIIARTGCEPAEDSWYIELEARGAAMEPLMRIAEKREKLAKSVVQPFAGVHEPGSGMDFDKRLEQMISTPEAVRNSLTPEEQAEHRREMDALHARDKAATETLRQKQQEEAEERSLNEALKPAE